MVLQTWLLPLCCTCHKAVVLHFHNPGLSILLPGPSGPELAFSHLPFTPAQLPLQATLGCFLSLPLLYILFCFCSSAFQNLSQISPPPGSLPGHTPTQKDVLLPPLSDHAHPTVVPSWFCLTPSRLGVSQDPRQALFVADFSSPRAWPATGLSTCLSN